MKSVFYFMVFLGFVCLGCNAFAKMTDAERLGIMAGSAVACGATKKLDDFELIASRILANQSATDEIETANVQRYMETKYRVMNMQKMDMETCDEVLRQFNALPIFQSVVYADGSVKLPDGKWSKPLRKVKHKKK